MPSESDLLNDSLSQFGATPIRTINDGSVNAGHCLRLYPALRKAALRLHHWNFATTRAALVQDTAPPFEFAFAYTLPTDYIKLTEYNGASLDTTNTTTLALILQRFKIESRRLLTNDGEVKIVYIWDVTDPNLWDPLFYQFMAGWLSSKLVSAIAKDDGKARSALQNAFNVLLPMALAADGQEGTITTLQSDELTWGR